MLLIACGKESISPTAFELVASGSDLSLQAIRFATADTGYAVGGNTYSDGIVIQTTDGGATWTRQVQNDLLDKIVYDVMPISGQRAWASAFDSKLLYSQDGGSTWQLIQTGSPGMAWQPLRAIWLLGDTVAVMVGGQATFIGVAVRLNTISAVAQYQAITGQLNDVWFSDAQRGYACGYGVAYRTDDGGVTWQNMELRGDEFTAVCFPTPAIGYIAGAHGTIWKTEDSGTTWQKIYGESIWHIGGRHRFNDLLFTSATEGWLVGDGLVWHTADGGDKWQCYESDLAGININAIAQHPNGDVWVVGDEGAIFKITP